MTEKPLSKSNEKLALSDPARWSWGTRIFAGIAKMCWRAPLAVVLLCTLTAALCCAYTYYYLEFDSNRSNLIKRSPELQAKQDRYTEEFPDGEDIVVIAEGGSAEENKAYVNDLAARLRAEPQIFSFVFEKIDASFLRRYALHYLDVPELKRIADGLGENRDMLAALGQSSSIIDCAPLLANRAFGKISDEELKLILPVINSMLEQLQNCISTRGRNFTYKSPWQTSIMGNDPAASEQMAALMQEEDFALYSTLADGKIYVVLLRPTYSEGVPHPICIERAVVRLKAIMKDIALQHVHVIPRLTGELILDYDEGQTSSEDSTLSAIISVILVTAIFMWAFRELYRPMMAVYSLAIGVGWTMAFATVAVGHLNLLTVTCTTILIGLGIDYGIHFIYRYEEERSEGLEPLAAMTETLARAGQENFTGAFSTALAFGVLNLTDFTGIAELGTIAGGGILLCYAANVLVLPAFLFWYETWGDNTNRVGLSSFAWLSNWEGQWLKHPQLLLVLFLLFTIWCGMSACRVRYDYNLLNLQSQDLDSVKAELYLMESSDHSLLYGISLVKNAAEAKKLMAAYEKLPTVANTECAALIVPEDYERKRPYLESCAALASSLPLPAEWQPYSGSMIQKLLRLEKLMTSSSGDIEDSLNRILYSSDPEVAAQGRLLQKHIDDITVRLESMLPGPIGDSITAFDRCFFADLRTMVTFLKAQAFAPKLAFADMPPALRERELGRHGLIQVRVFPKENVWERSAQERFVHDLESVDPQVVGMPVLTYYDSQVLREANEQAGMYALIAIWILLFIYFRNAKLALLALMPKVVGVLWMVGIMGACGVDFNSANFLALPMILGIGLVFGIHVVHRVLEEGEAGIFAHSTGPAIALAALTTMAGFGTLMLASYRGIADLGFVMTVGVGTNLISSAVLLPVFIKWLRQMHVSLGGRHE
ncbi:MAG: MMPL family transporter [bacterium]|nr:MMPL family transporter [bacterium]